MKKILLVFAVSAVLILLLASAALAQTYGDGGMNASPTATASATASPTATATATASPTATATATATAAATASPTATASALPTTGGPPLGGLVTWVATLTLIASGVGAVVLLRGGGAVS
jgi:hypothetical protein